MDGPDSFFKARDLFDTALYYGRLNLTLVETSVFRYLLENVMYKTPNPDRYGYVISAALGVDTVARMSGAKPTATKSALRSLETKGLIKRASKPQATGGRAPSDIHVIWLSEGARNVPSEGSLDVPSILL